MEEVRLLGELGYSAIGWSGTPEVIVANAFGMKSLQIACVSDGTDVKAALKDLPAMDIKKLFEEGKLIAPKVKKIIEWVLASSSF